MCEYSYFLPNDSLLRIVCGANGDNIKLVEKTLQCSVYMDGLRLYIETEDEGKKETFCNLLDTLTKNAQEGRSKDISELLEDVNLFSSDTTHDTQSIKLIYQKRGSFSLVTKTIFPKSQNQADYITKLKTCNIVLCYGASGSGKTYLALSYALSLLLSGKVKKLVFTRPIVEAGETLGFLPGNVEDKIDPYMRPFFDILEDLLPMEVIKNLLNTNKIESIPLAYMRGRTLNNTIMILDEAQNTTNTQMKMFISRLGLSSKAFITGDITQVDLPKKVESGFIFIINLLSPLAQEEKEIEVQRLLPCDIVRSRLVKKIVSLYDSVKGV